MPSYSEKLIVLCPSHFKPKWTALADLFTPAGHLQLIVTAGNYARVEEGEQSKYYDFFNGAGVTITPRRVGFNVTVTDQRFELRLAMEELNAISLSTGYGNYVPVTIHDYVRPEWQDYHQQGYTKRVGKIDGFEDGAGGGSSVRGYRKCDGMDVPSTPGGRYGTGFRFRFLERTQRLIA